LKPMALRPCYIRPIVAAAATAEIGVSPRARHSRSTSPTSLGQVLSWSRWRGRVHLQLEPPGSQHHARVDQSGANYMNSQLIHMEAEINGYQEGIGLDVNGLVSEGSGGKHSHVRNGVLYTRRSPTPRSPASLATACSQLHATWASRLSSQSFAPRVALHRRRSLSSPAPPPRSRPIPLHRTASHRRRKTRRKLQKRIGDEFFGIANDSNPNRFGWLTPVKVNASEAGSRVARANLKLNGRPQWGCPYFWLCNSKNFRKKLPV